MEHKKYELTNETLEYDGVTLYRIRALKSFGIVEKGDLGGFVQFENNLSHEGNCWVYNDAKVFENAYVFQNAKVFNNAIVRNNAKVLGNAKIMDNAKVLGNAKITDNVDVYGDANVSGCVHGSAKVDGIIEANSNVLGFNYNFIKK